MQACWPSSVDLRAGAKPPSAALAEGCRRRWRTDPRWPLKFDPLLVVAETSGGSLSPARSCRRVPENGRAGRGVLGRSCAGSIRSWGLDQAVGATDGAVAQHGAAGAALGCAAAV